MSRRRQLTNLYDNTAHAVAFGLTMIAALDAAGVSGAKNAARTIAGGVGLSNDDPKVALYVMAMSLYALRGATIAAANTFDSIKRFSWFAPKAPVSAAPAEATPLLHNEPTPQRVDAVQSEAAPRSPGSSSDTV